MASASGSEALAPQSASPRSCRPPPRRWGSSPAEPLRFLAVNDAAVARYGYSREEFLTTTVEDIRPQRTRDGRTISVEVSSSPLLFAGRQAELVVPTDVTPRLQLEEQLRQARKMEAVGRLAAGVAHDFNNLLTAVLGHTELALLKVSEGDAIYRDLVDIRAAGERAAALTRQLLTVGRK